MADTDAEDTVLEEPTAVDPKTQKTIPIVFEE